MEKTQSHELNEGATAPDFNFKNPEGKEIKLSDFRGRKKVVVYFYPRDFTPGCTTEANEFSRDYEMFEDEGIEIVGISPDDDESHVKFRQKISIPYMLAADTNNEISKKYGVYGLKTFMGKEYMGVTRSTFLVDKKGIIAKIFRKVKPAGHSKEVIDSFKEKS